MAWVRIKACDAGNYKSEVHIPIAHDLPDFIYLDFDAIRELYGIYCPERVGSLHPGAFEEKTRFEVEVTKGDQNFGIDLVENHPLIYQSLFC